MATTTDFEHYLRSTGEFSDAEISKIGSVAVTRSLSRNQYLLRAGEVCKYKTFVVHGLLQNFTTRQDGAEHILKFSIENSWLIDKESYDRQLPSATNISAVERSIVLQWSRADFETLVNELPGLKRVITQLTNDNLYSSQRLLNLLSETTEKRYEIFIKDFPELLARLPLKLIASYLGMSTRTLDRIRHNQLTR